MKRHSPNRFQPRLETLEDRCTPGAVSLPFLDTLSSLAGHGGAALVGASSAGAAKKSDTLALPFKINGGGPAPGGLPLFPGGKAVRSATGVANYLGKYTSEGTFELKEEPTIDPDTGAVSGKFQGTVKFVAANGDILAMTYGAGFSGIFTGQLNAEGTAVENVEFDAIFRPTDESTGRFENVSGSFRMIAKAEYVGLIPNSPYTAAFDYTWSGVGTLVFNKGKK